MTPQSQRRLLIAAAQVAFIAILLATIGIVFWQHLRHEVELNALVEVEADWGAALGFLHIDNQRPDWVFDRSHSEEAYTVGRLRQVHQITSPEGNILEESSIFQSIRATPQTPGPRFYSPQYSIAWDESHVPYMIDIGWIRDAQNRRYGFAIGRSLAAPYRRADAFLVYYALICLPLLGLASVFSWWLTRIAMRKSAI